MPVLVSHAHQGVSNSSAINGGGIQDCSALHDCSKFAIYIFFVKRILCTHSSDVPNMCNHILSIHYSSHIKLFHFFFMYKVIKNQHQNMESLPVMYHYLACLFCLFLTLQFSIPFNKL